MNAPRISVVMPVYNRDWCVGDAIESVLATGRADLELIIVDDGSIDGTPSIIAQYMQREPGRVRALTHAGRANRGIARSRNLGVSQSRGEFIAFLDSDDVFLANRFDTAMDWLDARPAMAGCIEPCTLSNMRAPFDEKFSAHLTTVAPADHGWLRAALFKQTCWNMPSITLRRASLDRFGGFDERLRFAEETSLWLRLILADAVGVAQAQAPVARVRRHDDHSWNHADRAADMLTFLHVLTDATRWSPSHGVAPDARALLIEKLHSFVGEILCEPHVPARSKAAAWLRGVMLSPSLAFDKRVVGDVLQAWRTQT